MKKEIHIVERESAELEKFLLTLWRRDDKIVVSLGLRLFLAFLWEESMNEKRWGVFCHTARVVVTGSAFLFAQYVSLGDTSGEDGAIPNEGSIPSSVIFHMPDEWRNQKQDGDAAKKKLDLKRKIDKKASYINRTEFMLNCQHEMLKKVKRFIFRNNLGQGKWDKKN